MLKKRIEFLEFVYKYNIFSFPKNSKVNKMEPSKKILNHFLNTAPAALYEYIQNQDGSGVIRYVSPASKLILGYPSKYFIGQDISRLINVMHSDDRERFAGGVVDSVKDSDFSSEVRIVWPCGGIKYVWFCSRPAAKSKEGFITWVGYAVDITTQKQAEKDLKKALNKVDNLNQTLENRVKEITKELERNTHRLLELNSALNVLLGKREEDKKTNRAKYFSKHQDSYPSNNNRP